MSDYEYSRRAFINKLLIGQAPSELNAPQHTLVCIFLRGGADTLNMFVPYGDDDYYKSRPTIAIKKPQKGISGCAVKLNDFYALHPKMAPLLPLFREGRLGVVQSVGSDNPSGSHFEAQDQIEHGVACGQSNSGGWLGRYLQTRAKHATSPLSAVAIGATVPESLRGAPGASALTSIDMIKLESPAKDQEAVAAALRQLYGCETGLLRQPGKDTLELLTRVEKLRDRKDAKLSKQSGERKSEYPQTKFGKGLHEVARLIKANVGVEVACLDLDGWDTHFFQGSIQGLQAELIEQLASGLAAFDADVTSKNPNVTVIVQTEFGRRTYENSSMGTDQGRGFALIALGASVNGGTIHGAWPGLAKQQKDIIGPAGLTVAYDYRSVLGEILASISESRRLSEIFPNFTPRPVGLIRQSSPPLA